MMGLSLAIHLSGPFAANAAGSGKNKTIRLAQTPLDLNSTPVPNDATTVPARVPTQPGPNPNDLDVPAAPVPAPPSGQPVPGAAAPAPTPQGTRSKASPPERPPLGYHYGEQERLNDMQNPDRRKTPWPAVPYQGMVNPPSPLPQNSGGTVLTPVPQADGVPVEIDAVAPPPSNVDRFGFAPPPGTLGQTYKRRSRVIEDSKHPRVGAVEVALPEDVDVTGVGLKVKWTGKVWRLESEPLLPGIPHIYEIKAYWGEGTEPQIRTVRLIMGRIVDLEF